MCRKLSVRCIVRAAICSRALSRSCNTSCADQRRWRCREAQKQALGSVSDPENKNSPIPKQSNPMSFKSIVLPSLRLVTTHKMVWMNEKPKLIPLYLNPFRIQPQSRACLLKCEWGINYCNMNAVFNVKGSWAASRLYRARGSSQRGLHENQWTKRERGMWGLLFGEGVTLIIN